VLKDVHGDQMGIVYVAKDISSLKQVEKHLHYLANHDNLTGLPNRLLFLDRLAQSLAANSRDNTSSAVLFLDLDRFKAVNDTLGHEAGDVLLKHVAERLSSSVRKSDTVARLGGDEFVVLLNHIKDEKYVDELAEKILAELRRPIDLMGNSYIATTSIGVSISPRDGEEPDQVLKKADMAMYEAKRRGKNTYCIFASEMEEIQETTFHAEHALRTADIEREFVVYYQPIVSAESQDIIGTEALVRWHRDDGEIVQPGGFLNMAEDTGMIIPIGAHVLRQACIQTRAWQKQGLGELMVSVNISDRQFHHFELITDIEVALKDSGLAPGDLHLELTEGVLMFNTERAPGVIQAMKDMGCHISVDDFGTGYSSLSHLQKIALDTIKIDRSFVHELPGNRNDATICEAIISLAQKLNLNIVAEGVETREHVDFLTNMGASSLQGYFYGKPMLAEELEKLLRNEI
jgi:diguanylate cyclase (GGDEF)-like protein